MVNGLLPELDDYNCWTLAEAAGHASPCPMQHLLSRARCDDRAMLDAAADWTIEQLHGEQDGDSGNAVLIVDETAASARPSPSATRSTGALDLRRGIRELGTGYVMAVRCNHAVTLPSGRRLTVKTAGNLVKPSMWQRMRTGSATTGAKDYHWAMIETTPDDTPAATMTGTCSCSCAATDTPAPSATTCAGARGPSRWPS